MPSLKLDNNRLNANAAEDWLAGALVRHGFALEPGAPSIVLMHLGQFGIKDHGWKFSGPTGWLEPVRIFGERHPLLIADVSALSDPYAGTGLAYSSPLPAQADVPIATLIRDLTEYRVLQASIYPISTAPCHAVTGILGVKATSLGAVGVLRPVEDALHPDWIKTSFDHLTGTNVFFEFKLLSLPVDDPAMYALQLFLTLNWENYHVDHPGCEEYLSVVFANDAVGVPGGGILGIGTYDDNPGKRMSMSWVHDAFRLLLDPESPGCAVGSEVFSDNYCLRKEYMNWWDYLLSHETGHILGQRHTHDVSSNTASASSNDSFSATWSSMSYQQDVRMIDFGAVDHNNWLRNRAGFALQLAAEKGSEGSPAWTAAMDAAKVLDWQGVWEALR